MREREQKKGEIQNVNFVFIALVTLMVAIYRNIAVASAPAAAADDVPADAIAQPPRSRYTQVKIFDYIFFGFATRDTHTIVSIIITSF